MPRATAYFGGNDSSEGTFMTKTLRLTLIAAGTVVLSGCITHESTVVRDVDRTPVEFENDAAARIFYETLSKMPSRGDHAESTTQIDIPVVFEHKRHVVTGPNVAFNTAVSRCDTNKDGKITEQEAHIFADNADKTTK